MSRSALWHQEKNQQLRLAKAEESFRTAIEEGKAKDRSLSNKRNNAKLVPLRISSTNNTTDDFHFNPMLLNNIIHSQYFVKSCTEILDWKTLVDEIYYHVKHLEPWSHGRGGGGNVASDESKLASTAFCLLLRLFTLRCSDKQMLAMLEHQDSPYIRGIGFLYLRYGCAPNQLWDYIQPYLFDKEPIDVELSSKSNNSNSKRKHNRYNSGATINTIGDFVKFIFTTRDYFGTKLPRLPIEVEREIAVKILAADKIQKRANQHFENKQTMQKYFSTVGSKVIALYGDDENPTQWYHGVIDRIVNPNNNDNSYSDRHPKFVVTFPEYGNTEQVALGEMDIPPIDGSLPYYNGSTGIANDESKVNSRKDYNNKNRGIDHGGHYSNGNGNNINSRGKRENEWDDYRHNYDQHEYNSNSNGSQNGTGRFNNQNRDVYNDNSYDGSRNYQSSSSYYKQEQPQGENLYEEIRRRERENVTARGRSEYATRPSTTKSSLASSSQSSRQQRGFHDDLQQLSPCSNSNLPKMTGETEQYCSNNDKMNENYQNNHSGTTSSVEISKRRSAEEIAIIQQKKRKLLAKYG